MLFRSILGSLDNTIRLWDVGTGMELLGLPILPSKAERSVAFSPDGGKLAYSSGESILIYDFHAYDEDIERWLREAGVEADLSRSTRSRP